MPENFSVYKSGNTESVYNNPSQNAVNLFSLFIQTLLLISDKAILH